ncbi:hypothetical protein TNCV_821731 [Trichonephila clavipes]|nr:hypothetical protein TNCV_821731 [Trichonephila clavipes]
MNAKPFQLVPVISYKVMGVSETSDSCPTLDAIGDYLRHPRACEFSSLDRNIKGHPALSGIISGTYKIQYLILVHHTEVNLECTFHASRPATLYIRITLFKIGQGPSFRAPRLLTQVPATVFLKYG